MAPFSFQSFAPANLQHRLLSFLVRRFLAPLLKDRGQSLDRQLSAQTQPAIFTLTNVDLDPGAVEDLFAGSGLPLSILTASVSELSLQINWPSWSFSLQDYVPDVKIKLHNIQLTLGLSTPGPESLNNDAQLLKNLDLDASLAHIADDFVRQEWPDSASAEEQKENELPGAFSQKLKSPVSSKNEDRRGFFAGLVHNILAKFNFEFSGLSLLLRHQRVEALFLIHSGLSSPLPAQDQNSVTSMSREIRISPPVLHLQHLPTPADPASSLSSLNRSLDSDHDMFMSQGIADLRAPVLSTSTAELSTPACASAKSECPSAYITHLAKPETVFLQFLPIPAHAQAPGLDEPVQGLSTPESDGPETDEQPLDPNDSLRFLFRISNGPSSAIDSTAEPIDSKETRPLSAALASHQTTPATRNLCGHSKLDVQIRLPILSISVQSPQHVFAMAQLLSSLMIIMPTASETSASNIPISNSDMQPLAIDVSLTCHQLNCILNFPPQSPLSSHLRDTPRSIELQAKILTLTYSSVLSVSDKDPAFTKPRTEIAFQLDQIQGAFSICHFNKTSFFSKTFLLAPVRDHPGPALAASHTDVSVEIDLSSIWVSPDLEALSVFKPAFVTLQAAISLAEPKSHSARNVHHAKGTATEPTPTDFNDIGGPTPQEEVFQMSLFVPCLYIDLKAPIPREVKNAGQRQPGLVLGAVVKSLKITRMPLRSISCNIFEAALGFRVGAARGSPSHAPLSPFLGIAHPLPTSTKDAKHSFPGLFITHTCAPSPHAHFNPLKHSSQPTAITLETITIDLTKDQFDRLQCWLDDLGRWANESLSESELSAEQPALPTALLGESEANSAGLKGVPSKSANTGLPPLQSSLLASMTISQVALTLHLPPSDGGQNKGKQKCVFQMSHLSLDQLGPASGDQFESELRLRVTTVAARLHDEGGIKTLLEVNTKERKSSEEAMPAVLVSICTSAAQAPTCVPKQITVSIEVCHTTLYFGPSCIWSSDLLRFLKAPAGVFEAVGPEYQTQIKLLFVACLLQFTPPAHDPPHQGSSYMLEIVSNRLECGVRLDPGSTSISPQIKGALSIYLGDYPSTSRTSAVVSESISFARIASLSDMEVSGSYSWVSRKPTWRATMHQGTLALSFCPDSADSLSEAIDQLGKISFTGVDNTSGAQQSPVPVQAADEAVLKASMLKSALREPPANARSLLIERDEDLAEEDYPADADFVEANPRVHPSRRTTAKANSPIILRSLVGSGLNIIDDFLLHQRPWSKVPSQGIEGEFKVEHLDVSVGLHSGYDWSSTRQAIHDAQKTVRKRLQKLRQLLATGNPADASIEDELAPTTLFKSLHLGMASSPLGLTTAQLLSAIDDELEKSPEPSTDDAESIIGSWQSLPLNSAKDHDTRATSASHQHHSLGRSAHPMLKVVLAKLQGCFRKFVDATPDPENPHRRISSFHLKADSLTVIDNIRTSTWRKFLTELRPSEGGMMRPTGSPMLRMKFDILPSTEQSRQREGFFKLKISPLRLYVDQDAVDFMKSFFAFQKDSSKPRHSDPAGTASGLFFQRVEIFPIRIRLDYKPKRINYMALREGKAIELMNFFHFESSDMVLRHATLIGLTRASKIGELLQDIWTPDVKANQLADVISGIAPVRSVVNVGSGIADLLLLPIEQVRKDGRWTRGLQKGTASFAKSTALEAIKLGAKLATGTQVVLERAEAILGARLPEEMRVETVESGSPTAEFRELDNDRHPVEMISRYADQPENVKMGAKLAYRDLRDNIRTTAQTILAVPLEVFNEGSGQAVVKAVPIAILHPMVGATGAISKTLLGLRNTLDPHASDNDEDKYKRTSTSR